MDEPTTYRIVIRGDAGPRVLRPFVDDFAIHRTGSRTTFEGDVVDVAHLHGLLVHLTSLNAEVISLTAIGPDRSPS